MPRRDQQSWIHEIAVDIIALWSCGPAFLAAMMDVAENSEPFLVDSPHPPYALRLKMLALCAENLGWQKEAQSLVELESQWASVQTVKSHNRYLTLCPAELVQAALSWALEACREWSIPKCTRAQLRSFTDRRQKNCPIDSANELIGSAWLIFESNPRAYPEWEARTVRCLRDELNGDS
jgi:hypothetical protein